MVFNLELLKNFLLVFAFLYSAYQFGVISFPTRRWEVTVLPGAILAIALQSIFQAIAYYLSFPLGATTDIISILLTTAVAIVAGWRMRKIGGRGNLAPPHPTSYLLHLILIILTLLCVYFVIQDARAAATVESIRTPWPLLQASTLWAIAGLWALMVLTVRFVRSGWLVGLNATITLVAILSITPLLYRIGFGFDGFLHIASEKILLATGTLSPKPFYYIGQYVATTWLARLSHINIATIDRWFVPIAATVCLPLFLLLSKKPSEGVPTEGGETPPLHASILLFGLLPLAAFVTTTPQALAYILGLSATFLAQGIIHRTVHPLAPLLLAAWSVVTHPLAGIPFLCIVLAIWSIRISRRPRLSSSLSATYVVLGGLSIPLLFWVISFFGKTPIAWHISALLQTQPWHELINIFNPFIGNRFVLWPAWSSVTIKALPLLLIALACWGWWHESIREHKRVQAIFIWSAVLLWIGATVLKTTGDFSFLVDYERGNYADRLKLLAVLVLIPALQPLLSHATKKRSSLPRVVTWGSAIFFIAFATGLTYNSLPRHDALVTGRGWSTSIHDIETVKLIDRDAEGLSSSKSGSRPYVVLANQSVSAAAVATLGFKRYVNDVFFYPIPTGGPLYQIFLHMVYDQPSHDTVKDAAELGQADLVYVVINDYWWRAEAVSEDIRQIADQDWEIGNGKVKIFKFDLAD